MIILIVDKLDVLVDKPKCDAPVPVDPNRPMALQISLQRMQLERGKFQLIGRFRSIKSGQDNR